MRDWIARDDDEYVDIALRSTPDRLRTVREKLPDLIARRRSPVAYTRAAEAAYRTMWERYCGGRGEYSDFINGWIVVGLTGIQRPRKGIVLRADVVRVQLVSHQNDRSNAADHRRNFPRFVLAERSSHNIFLTI
jgi:hypothetical protein